MKINKEQFDHFLQHNEPAFIKTIVQHLQTESPELVDEISDEGLSEMVGNGLIRARSHGFHTDEDLMAFVAVMFEIAPNFDEQPDIQRVLSDSSIPLTNRFNALFDESLDQAWEEAEDNYDYRAWHPELNNEI